MPTKQNIFELSQLYSGFSDGTRLKNTNLFVYEKYVCGGYCTTITN